MNRSRYNQLPVTVFDLENGQRVSKDLLARAGLEISSMVCKAEFHWTRQLCRRMASPLAVAPSFVDIAFYIQYYGDIPATVQG